MGKAPKVIERQYDCFVRIYPADVESEWISECPAFSLVSQGSGPAHSLEMMREAILLTVGHDLLDGREPTFRRAPEEEISKLFEDFLGAKSAGDIAADGAELCRWIVRMPLKVRVQENGESIDLKTPAEQPQVFVATC